MVWSLVRVAILVDNMYLEHVASAYGVHKLDMTKIPKVLLKDGEEHFRTFVFDALPFVPQNGATPEQIERKNGKKKYLDKLQYLERITVEQGKVKPKSWKCPGCNEKFNVPVQKLVDVKLSVRLVALGSTDIVDVIVLVTGDADMIPALDAIKNTRTTVRLAYADIGNVKTSKSLVRCCPEKKILEEQDISFCKLA